MEWFIFAFFTALFSAVASLIQKRTLNKGHAMQISTSLAIINVILLLPLFFTIDYLNLKLIHFVILFIASIFSSLAFLLVAKSVRHMEISEAAPLLILAPLITSLIAFFILGEKLKLIQIFGMIFMIIGAYILETRKHQKILDPIRKIKNSKYIHYIIFALLLYGTCATFDRLLLGKLNMQVEVYILFLHIFMAINFIVMSMFFYDGVKDIKKTFKNNGWWILLISIFIIGYRFFQSKAVQLTDSVGLVIAIKRSSVLLVTLIGGEFFHEKNLFRKTVACIIMIIGLLLIVL